MTVVDTSVVVDVLLGTGAAEAGIELMAAAPSLAAPDLLAFEVLAVLRRIGGRGEADERRLAGAVEDLGALRVELFPTMSLRRRAWELRHNLTIAEGLFVALAEQLGEPLATKDEGLADAAARLGSAEIVRL